MKRMLFLLGFLAVLAGLVSGCATIQVRQQYPGPGPSQGARVTDPVVGCAPGTTWVSPGALEFDGRGFVDIVTVSAVNEGGEPRDISTTYRGLGMIVKNLCPGGLVNLAFARRVFSGSDYEYVVLTSVGHDSRGRIYTESTTINLQLSYGNSGVRSQNYPPWILQRR